MLSTIAENRDSKSTPTHACLVNSDRMPLDHNLLDIYSGSPHALGVIAFYPHNGRLFVYFIAHKFQFHFYGYVLLPTSSSAATPAIPCIHPLPCRKSQVTIYRIGFRRKVNAFPNERKPRRKSIMKYIAPKTRT